ncbi:MAG TPA: nuclease domain-containing protein [Gammaproteobacteria bacterium]|nr:nuclease domain-containing protein [Gammaproteobacteria bacterium]
MITKSKPIRSKKIRDAARGELCTLRIPGVCCGDPETTVLCHAPFGGKSMGLKAPDTWAAAACHRCHAVADGRELSDITREELLECWLRGIAETQMRLFAKGLLKAEGAK